MISYIFFITTYFLSTSGFILGKSTYEEHKEIKKYILTYIINILLIIFYSGLLILSYKSAFFYIFIILLIIHASLILKIKSKDLQDFFQIILYSTASIFLFYYQKNLNSAPLILLLIFYIFFQNSFHKINFKEEAYKFLFLSIFYITFNLIINLN